MKRATVFQKVLAIVSLLSIAAFAEISSSPQRAILGAQAADQDILQLTVPTIMQSTATSCGEAAIAMAYDYAYPRVPIEEQAVIEYAEAQGLYMPDLAPFTSPADMVARAQPYAGDIATGQEDNQDEGLEVLTERLGSGDPVIIDITTLLSDPQSDAHFVVVTGVSVDPYSGIVTISYNNPLTGEAEHADWAGSEGIWQAWENNGDPGGSGWWLVIPPSAPTWRP